MSVVRKNLVALLATQLATWAVALVSIVLVPRYLGPDDFGILSFAAAFVGFFTLIGGLGTSTLLTREVARDPSVIGPYVFNAVMLKLVLGTALSVICIGLARAFGTTGGTLVLIAVGCLGMMFIIIGEVFFSALAGLQMMAKPAMWGVVQVYLTNAVGLLVLALGGGVVVYGTIFSLGTAIPGVATARMLRSWVHGHWHIDLAIWKWLVRAGLPLLALSVSNLIYGTVDVPILQFMSGSETVGWYSLAQKWVGIPVFISTAVTAAFFPSFAALVKTSAVDFAAQVNKALVLVMIAAVPAAVGLGVIAKDLLFLLYEDEFANSVSVMQILALQIPIAGIDTILAMALIAADRQRRYIFVALAAAVVNPIGCVVAINWAENRYENGAIGAAVVTVATELMILAAALWLRSPGALDRATLSKFVRIAMAGLTMGAIVYLADSWPLVIRIAIRTAVYGAASIAFRTISVRDVRTVLQERRASAHITPPNTIDDERNADGGDDTGGPVDAPHVGSDLYAQPGGQDRDSGPQRPGQ